MLLSKSKKAVVTGIALIFLIGTALYVDLYSSDFKRFDFSVALMSLNSAVRNFVGNNDALTYASRVPAWKVVAINFVCLLSLFMSALIAVKAVVANFTDRITLRLYGKRRRVCVFTENNAATMQLAASAEKAVAGTLNVFLDCDRFAELEQKKNYLYLSGHSLRRISRYKTEVFICGEDKKLNAQVFGRLSKLLKSAEFYVFSDSLERQKNVFALNAEELIVRYLFAASAPTPQETALPKAGFVPARFRGNGQANICIAGANKLAIELCKELIVQCQSVKGLPRITVIDVNAEDIFAFFVKSNPELYKCALLEFVNAPPESVQGISALTVTEYQMYFFCTENTDLSSLVPADKVIALPSADSIYDYNVLVNCSLDGEAKKLHAENVKKAKKANTVDPNREWDELSEFLRRSHRSRAAHIPSQLHLASLDMTLEELSEEEHLRWNAFHFVNGWRHGSDSDGKKDADEKLHPRLVPYDELPPEEQAEDLRAVENVLAKDEKRNRREAVTSARR
jgi:hypothetical protein